MGLRTDSSTYIVNAPGKYWVSINNTCGSKMDTIEVYQQCDFPIYMPTAFTPNNDNLNDRYSVPPLVKNQLLKLQIFNRWGQLLYETRNASQGWDGRFKGQPLDSGVFIYFLEMRGLSGQTITQKGSFILIR